LYFKVDLETGRKRSWIETEEKEIIDLCGEPPGGTVVMRRTGTVGMDSMFVFFRRCRVGTPMFIQSRYKIRRSVADLGSGPCLPPGFGSDMNYKFNFEDLLLKP
jgi:hypothetical protein